MLDTIATSYEGGTLKDMAFARAMVAALFYSILACVHICRVEELPSYASSHTRRECGEESERMEAVVILT